MAKAEDLTGRTFGYLKVLRRAENHICASGQTKVHWWCECLLCGKQKSVGAQDLKKGTTISCGCYQTYAGKLRRNKKVCVVCGKEFESPPSDETVTCSMECRKIRARNQRTGWKLSEETRKKISDEAKGRDMSKLLELGTRAAKESPNSGRFETNINAIDWHLIGPDGRHYYFHSLNFWLRENCRELFGCEPDSREYLNARSGLSGAKRAAMGKNYGCCTYKGWQVIPTDADRQRKTGENS